MDISDKDQTVKLKKKIDKEEVKPEDDDEDDGKHKPVPKTGDTVNMMLYLLLAMLSVTGFTILAAHARETGKGNRKKAK